jgi:hypothetical protein
MRFTKYISMLAIMMSSASGFAQTNANINTQKYARRLLTIEPSVGIHTNFGTDLLLSTMVQWSPMKRLAFASHSSYNINNITQRDFNFIKTDYNYSLNQKFGIGTTLYAKKSSHSFFIMAGLKYTAYRETLNNPDLEKISTAISAVSPDYGLMYSLKKGGKKCFFTFRAYLPLYPWPVKGADINYVDGNMNNIALEFGVGIKIK